MSTSTHREVECPACGAARRYDAEGGTLHCDFCKARGERQPEPVLRGVAEIDLEELVSQEEGRPGPPMGEETTSCQSCGAHVSHGAELKSLTCPFCASPLIRDAKDNPATFQPRGIIPFSVTPEQASGAIRDWASRLWLRPSKVQRLSRPAEIRGVYVPFWTVDCRSRSDYRGQVRRVEEREEWQWFLFVPYRKETRTVVVTEPVQGTRSAQFDDVLITASRGLPLEQTREIEPFHTVTSLLPYEPKYLAGWSAEESVVGPSEAWTKAEEHLRRVEYRNAVQAEKRSTQDVVEIDLEYRFFERTGKPILLPIYVAAYRYAGKSYRVLVNGETGQVWGQAPYSYVKLALLLLVLVPFLVALTVVTAGSDLLLLAVLALGFRAYARFKENRGEERNVRSSPARYDPPKRRRR